MKSPTLAHKIFNSHSFAIAVLLLLSWSLWEFSDAHFRWSGGQKKTPIENNIYADGAAYYAYLPKWFYHGENDFSFFDAVMKKYPDSRFDDNLGLGNGEAQRTNKYYTGTAALITPFFLIGHVIEANSGGITDGYSSSYLMMASVAAIFYWLVGALAIYLFLHRIKIPSLYIFLTIIAITFGTNLMYYVVYAPTYSHVYSFACVSWLLYIAKRWSATGRAADFLVMGMLIGLGFIIRPTNVIVVLLIPFLFDSTSSFFLRVKELFTRRLALFVLFFVLCGIPLVLHFANLDNFNSYRNEGFDYLSSPYVLEVLFGVRRGIFFYAPGLLLSIFGLFVIFRNWRSYFWGFLFVFSIFTYVISSWWCWWYGGGFSMRPFVDILPIFALPIALLLYKSHVLIRFTAVMFLLTSIGLTQVYTYQINHQIIHTDGMNWKDFKTVFLQTDRRFEWYPYLKFDELPKEYDLRIESIAFEKNNFPVNKYSLTYGGKRSMDLFAGMISGQFEIATEEGKPLIEFLYFKSDSILLKQDLFFGARIAELQTPTNLSLDVYPELQYQEFDSVRITLFDGGAELGAKNLKLDLYSKTNVD